jgi:uncharacterized membrane protein
MRSGSLAGRGESRSGFFLNYVFGCFFVSLILVLLLLMVVVVVVLMMVMAVMRDEREAEMRKREKPSERLSTDQREKNK